ncbi:MAG TPA: CoA-binding protein [Bacteroidota bacterium]
MPLLTSDSDIDQLLRTSQTIAVVGLSANPGRDSYRVSLYMQQQGYTIIPVNPTVQEVLGARSVPDLEQIGRPVDIVDIFRRSEHVPAIVEAAIRTGARAVWTQLGIVHEEAARRAVEAGLTVVIDRCLLIEHRRFRRRHPAGPRRGE